MSEIKLSKYQFRIIDYFKFNPRSNMLINALAGSGKTSTILELLKTTDKQSLYVAFNKKIQEEMTLKVENLKNKDKIKVATIHSLCLSVLYHNLKQENRKGELNNYKIYNIIRPLCEANPKIKYNSEYRSYLTEEYVKLYNLLRLTCTDFENNYAILKIVEDYNLFNDNIFYVDNNDILLWVRKIDKKSLYAFEETGVFDFTDILYITLKKLQEKEWQVPGWSYYTNIMADECLTGNTYVKTSEGTKKLKSVYNIINNKNKDIFVKSFNHNTESFEYKKILNAKKHQNREVYRIKTEGLNIIEATENHRFYTQRGYVRVDELVIGQDMLILDNPHNQKAKYLLNEDQFQLVLASSIGDGHLQKMSKFNTYRIRLTQGYKQLNYLRQKSKILNCEDTIYKMKSGYCDNDVFSSNSKIFALKDDLWTSMENINEKFLAVWFQDDGTTYFSKNKNVISGQIACNNLTEHQTDFLINLIKKKFNIDLIKVFAKNKYWQIRINKESTEKLLKIIAPYMNEELAYKNPFFDKNNLYEWDYNFKQYGCNFISSIDYVGIQDVYDIEVEDNNNFICKISDGYENSGILSHNCQDLSLIQLFLLKYFKRMGGRYVFVGDVHQSIYNFCGADSQCFYKIKNLYKPIESFDLPICYRCAKSHLEMVNEKFNIPIIPCSNAPEGRIETINKEQIYELVQAGDYIIGRKNKWLFPIMVKLIKKGIPIYFPDKEFVNNIVKTIEKTKTNNINELKSKIEQIENKEKLKESKKKPKRISEDLDEYSEQNEEIIKNIETVKTSLNNELDKYDTIQILLESFKDKSKSLKVEDFILYIKKILNTETKNSKEYVTLSSIHKIKGCETDRVFLLNQGKPTIDSRNSRQQTAQEYNISYISITRAKEVLYLVKSDKEDN